MVELHEPPRLEDKLAAADSAPAPPQEAQGGLCLRSFEDNRIAIPRPPPSLHLSELRALKLIGAVPEELQLPGRTQSHGSVALTLRCSQTLVASTRPHTDHGGLDLLAAAGSVTTTGEQ